MKSWKPRRRNILCSTVKKMTDRIDALETENMALRKNVSDLDNCNRLDTLIIHGIRETALIATASTLEQSDQDSEVSEDLCHTVLQLCNNRLELDLIVFRHTFCLSNQTAEKDGVQ